MISSLSCSLLCISDTLSDDIIAQDQSYPNVPSHFAASEEEELTLPIKSSFWENIRNYKELDLTSFSKDFPLGAKILSETVKMTLASFLKDFSCGKNHSEKR
jgi:hypothetical protein